jgi:hypothetical protein
MSVNLGVFARPRRILQTVRQEKFAEIIIPEPHIRRIAEPAPTGDDAPKPF